MIKILLRLRSFLLLWEWEFAGTDTYDRSNLRGQIKYYWHGVKWKVRHPVASATQKMGVERSWVTKLRKLGSLFSRSQ